GASWRRASSGTALPPAARLAVAGSSESATSNAATRAIAPAPRTIIPPPRSHCPRAGEHREAELACHGMPRPRAAVWRRRAGPLIFTAMAPLLTAERPLADIGRPFQIHSEFKPAGDQPQAIRALVEGLGTGERDQVLL